jgi:hypothetical protein
MFSPPTSIFTSRFSFTTFFPFWLLATDGKRVNQDKVTYREDHDAL